MWCPRLAQRQREWRELRVWRRRLRREAAVLESLLVEAMCWQGGAHGKARMIPKRADGGNNCVEKASAGIGLAAERVVVAGASPVAEARGAKCQCLAAAQRSKTSSEEDGPIRPHMRRRKRL